MARVPSSVFTQYESVTVGAAAVSLTPAKISGQSVAFITCEAAEVRYRLDGQDPTATEGHLLEPGDDLTLTGINILPNFKAIRTTGTNAVLKCSYGT